MNWVSESFLDKFELCRCVYTVVYMDGEPAKVSAVT